MRILWIIVDVNSVKPALLFNNSERTSILESTSVEKQICRIVSTRFLNDRSLNFHANMRNKRIHGLITNVAIAGGATLFSFIVFRYALTAISFAIGWAEPNNIFPIWKILPIFAIGICYAFIAERFKFTAVALATFVALQIYFLVSELTSYAFGADIMVFELGFTLFLVLIAVQLKLLLVYENDLNQRLKRVRESKHFYAKMDAEARVESGLKLLNTVLPISEIIVFTYGDNSELTPVGRTRNVAGNGSSKKGAGSNWRNDIAYCEEAIKKREIQVQMLDVEKGSARIGVPLSVDGHIVGGFFVEIVEKFEEADRKLLESFADQLARNFERKELLAEENRVGKSKSILSRNYQNRQIGITKIIEGMLKEQSFGLEAVLQIPEPNAIAYLDGTLGFVNYSMRKLCGLTDGELSSSDLFSLLSCFQNEVFNDPAIPIRRVMQTGKTFSVSLEFGEDRTPYELEIKLISTWDYMEDGKKHKDPHAKPVGFLVSVREIEIKRENEKLRSDIVNLVSHELRTPITSIHGFSQMLLLDDSLNEETREYLTVIEKESQRAAKMLTNFLSASNLRQSDKKEFYPSAVQIDHIVSDVIETMKEPARRKRIRILDRQAKSIPTVSADRGLLTKALALLVDNAVKYSPERSSVIISTLIEADFLRVEVEDRGYGIPTDEQEKIWTKFYRVARDGHDKEDGSTGLGLPIVKDIIERHRGTVGVESQVGRGSKFTLRIPRM